MSRPPLRATAAAATQVTSVEVGQRGHGTEDLEEEKNVLRQTGHV